MGSDSGKVSFSQVVAEIVKETSYKIIDFYEKSYLEGGPTLDQVIFLYEEIQNLKTREVELQAALHGVKFKKPLSNSPAVVDPNVPVFRDPAEYEKMTPEQRERETQKLMAHTSKWVQRGLSTGKKLPPG